MSSQLLDIARGLKFLHSHGLVHGNLNAVRLAPEWIF